MTQDAHKAFDAQCSLVEYCSTDDLTLRNSTTYSTGALVPWREVNSNFGARWIPILMAVSCLTCSLFLVLRTLIPRLLAKLMAKKTYTEQDAVRPDSRENPFRDPQPDPAEDPFRDRDSQGSESKSSLRHRRGSIPLGPFKIQPKGLALSSEHSPSLWMTDEKLAMWQ